MKIALAQINPTIGAFEYNSQKIIARAHQARDMGCDLVVFSELVIPGYPPKDLLEKPDFVEANIDCLHRLVAAINGIGVICGYVAPNPAPTGKPLFNAAVLFEDGEILHGVNKRLLPTYDVFDEQRYFEPGGTQCAYSYKGHRLGVTICEDAWNDEDIFSRRVYTLDPVSLLAADGADLLINISASVFYMAKHAFRKQMLGSIARKYRLPLVYVNQVGGNDSLLFDGVSMAFDAAGTLAARTLDFQEDLVVFDSGHAAESGSNTLHPIAAGDVASVFKALVMGTRDYVTKCGFQKVVVGLSGGIDSALTACVAAEALGPGNVSTVFMPSRYTSTDNYTDTRRLARNLGVKWREIPIDDIFDRFVALLCPDFDPAQPGITEQNIQARIRGTILMALSNRHGSLVLSTGNKSELAVGYCTLYGDMNGGLSVISDVPKTLVYDLCRHINDPEEIIPLRILEKAPSAELKPDQTDQDDLPPYDELDAILKGYIEAFQSVDDLVARGHRRETVVDVIQRVDRNEYKRHQAAPGLKVTSKAFGYGRRYPLAQRFRQR